MSVRRLAWLLLVMAPLGHAAGGPSALSEEPLPYLDDGELPKVTPPIVQLGSFLSPGPIGDGFHIPTGAVWQPRLWVYGNVRVGYSSFSGDRTQRSEAVSAASLFANLQLTGTERILVGVEPLSRDGRFTRVLLDSDVPADDPLIDEFEDEGNGRITTLFFEGDFGELFPGLDADDSGTLDLGFSIGRQQIVFQDGFIVDDTLDAVGITRNNIRFGGGWLANLRLTALYAWDEVGRSGVRADTGDELVGLFTSWDTVFGNSGASTFDIDLVYRMAEDRAENLLVAGFGAVQRLGKLNSTVRLLHSMRPDDDSGSRVEEGTLLFLEFSRTPAYTHDLVYTNLYYGIDSFTSGARGPLSGGPLGRVGLTFAGPGLGSIPAPLGAVGSNPAESWGIALGYQSFWHRNRTQLVVEIGLRQSTEDAQDTDSAWTLQLQRALGRRTVLVLGGFGARDEGQVAGDAENWGGRLELLFKL